MIRLVVVRSSRKSHFQRSACGDLGQDGVAMASWMPDADEQNQTCGFDIGGQSMGGEEADRIDGFFYSP